VIVDSVEGPTPVFRVRIEPRQQDNGTRRPTFRFFELPPELVCKETPCVVDTPPGNILLGFPVLGCEEAFEYELVHVGPDPSVYRRSLSVYENDTGAEQILGIIAASVGSAATITGIALVPQDSDRVQVAGGITLGAGALLITAGVLMIRHDSATYRPGSANHFAAPMPVETPGGVVPPRRSPLSMFRAHPCNWSSRRALSD
jgi:hypothetical protein